LKWPLSLKWPLRMLRKVLIFADSSNESSAQLSGNPVIERLPLSEGGSSALASAPRAVLRTPAWRTP
jgi:hypothetical protein